MPSMFSIRDPVAHQALRRPVAQKFSMSSIKSLEPFADECTKIFLDSMKELQGQKVDLGVWLQWYAFDVIGAITFQRRFGFMEKREDVMEMIGGLDRGLQYAGIVGQVPALHRWLMGNSWVAKLLTAQPFVKISDPLRTMVNVSSSFLKYELNWIFMSSRLHKNASMNMIGFQLKRMTTGPTFWHGSGVRNRKGSLYLTAT